MSIADMTAVPGDRSFASSESANTSCMTASRSRPRTPLPRRASWRDSLAVYLQRRVLIVLLLGFSSGLPLALSGSTLLVWMRESGVDLGTIGLFALVGTPYTLKFLWAPLVDAIHVPLFTPRLRPPPRLAGVLATAADRSDPAAGADRSGALAAVRRARRAVGGCDLVDAGHRGRCFQGREPARERTGRRHGVLCRGLSHRHAGLDRGRAVHRQRLREHRHRRALGLDVGLCGDGRAGADRHRHGAGRDRARAIGARGSRDRFGDRVCARDACRGRRVLRIPGRGATPWRRWPSWCCSNSPTRFPAA